MDIQSVGSDESESEEMQLNQDIDFDKVEAKSHKGKIKRRKTIRTHTQPSFKSMNTFLLKNSPGRLNKNYDLKYILESIVYSCNNKKKVYLSNQSSKMPSESIRLFHPQSGFLRIHQL
jgi:hypothetical protein